MYSLYLARVQMTAAEQDAGTPGGDAATPCLRSPGPNTTQQPSSPPAAICRTFPEIIQKLPLVGTFFFLPRSEEGSSFQIRRPSPR